MSREGGSVWWTERAGSKAEIAKALWAKGGDPRLEWQRKVDGAWVADGFGEQCSVIDPKGDSVEDLRPLLDYGKQIWREAGWIWAWERHIEWRARGIGPGWSGYGPVPSTGKYKRKGRFGKSLWPGASLPLAAKALSEASLLLDVLQGPPELWARKAALALDRLAQKQLDAAVRDWDFDGYRWPESRCWKDQRKTRKQWGRQSGGGRWLGGLEPLPDEAMIVW
jgi:hypothetical protein